MMYSFMPCPKGTTVLASKVQSVWTELLWQASVPLHSNLLKRPIGEEDHAHFNMILSLFYVNKYLCFLGTTFMGIHLPSRKPKFLFARDVGAIPWSSATR